MFISLKPLAERGGLHHASASSTACAGSWRASKGISVFMTAAAGHPRRRAAGPSRSTSSRSGARSSTSSTPGCRRWWSACSQVPGPRRRLHRPRAGRPAGQHHHRPAGRRAPRRAHAGHQQRAQQRLRAAADLDHLHAAQPVSRHPGGRSALSSATRPICTRIYVPGRDGAQVPLTSVITRRPDAGAAGRQPPGAVPGGHHQLQPDAPT